MSEVPLYGHASRMEYTASPQSRSFRFFELPTEADTGNCSVERPCFLSDHIRPPSTEDRGKRLKGVLNRAFKPLRPLDG
jgi:hypothetical protein